MMIIFIFSIALNLRIEDYYSIDSIKSFDRMYLLSGKSINIVLPKGESIDNVRFDYTLDTIKGIKIESGVIKATDNHIVGKGLHAEEFVPFSLIREGLLRGFSIATFKYLPFFYIEKDSTLVYVSHLHVDIETKHNRHFANETKRFKYGYLKDYVKSIVINKKDVDRFYSFKYNYIYEEKNLLIIAPGSFKKMLGFYKDYKESMGFKVEIISMDSIYDNYEGKDKPAKIRYFLYRNVESINYVLLIGSLDSIPMRLCVPFNNELYSPYNNANISPIPTDLYYAELSFPDEVSWDSDGDGRYGEAGGFSQVSGDDKMDFFPEISVGRVPFNDSITVRSFLERLIAFEQNTDDGYKKRAELVGLIGNFKNENYLPKTDGASLMERIINTRIVSRTSATTLYEKEGLDASLYNCTVPVNHDNIIFQWQKKGLFNIWGHGNSKKTYRKIWKKDNGDGKPQYEEIAYKYALVSNDDTSIDSQFPAFAFLCSCLSGDIEEEDNLTFKLLKSSAAGIVSATRYSWYVPAWANEKQGGDASLDYFFLKFLLKDTTVSHGRAGKSLNLARSTVYQYDNDIYSVCNLYAFNLFSDPSMIYYGERNPDTVRELIFDEGALGKNIFLDYNIRYAVQFTPPKYPFRINSISFYISDTITLYPDNFYYYISYEWNGKPYFPVYSGLGKVSKVGGWNTYVPDTTIIVKKGDFFVAIQRVGTPRKLFLGADTAVPAHKRSWQYKNNYWQKISEDIDYMIRVTGFAGEYKSIEEDANFLSKVNIEHGRINFVLKHYLTLDIALYSVCGRKVFSLHRTYSKGPHTVKLSSLKSGVYFLLLKSDDFLYTEKFIYFQ